MSTTFDWRYKGYWEVEIDVPLVWKTGRCPFWKGRLLRFLRLRRVEIAILAIYCWIVPFISRLHSVEFNCRNQIHRSISDHKSKRKIPALLIMQSSPFWATKKKKPAQANLQTKHNDNNRQLYRLANEERRENEIISLVRACKGSFTYYVSS